MRSYWKLLRVPYQLQLMPIFGWGFLLAGGHLHTGDEIFRFLIAFICFHIGAFGGLTALNSFYDRDETPVGGMWNPPSPPRHLFAFAWLVQIAGFVPLIFLDWKLAAIYAAVIALALGYSHPRTRWKAQPAKSLVVVALGQGTLDFCAGAWTSSRPQWELQTAFGLMGATISVLAFYPLTQLFQIEGDSKRGIQTVAMLMQSRSRGTLFLCVCLLFVIAASLNIRALFSLGWWTDVILFAVHATGVLWFLRDWEKNGDGSPRDDFRRVHFLLCANAIGFGVYLLARLTL